MVRLLSRIMNDRNLYQNEEIPMEKAKPTVLIIEDEKPIRRFLHASLRNMDYRVVEAETGAEGKAKASCEPPDLVILDLGLPDMDGMEIIEWIREWSRVPIIILSARGQEKDKVAALDAGADDYLTKPFAVGELLARMRVAFRNRASGTAQGNTEPVFQAGDLVVDVVNRRVTLADKEVHLTPIEYRLLVVFIRNVGKVLTHNFLLKEVWGPSYIEDPRYIRVYVANLRQKIEVEPSRPIHLITEQGVGYRFVQE